MTNWRELGYVPDSEGEDSQEELVTQPDDVDVFKLVSQFVPPGSRPVTRDGEVTADEEKVEEEGEPEYMDIDEVLARARGSPKTVRQLDMTGGPMDVDEDEGGVRLEMREQSQQEDPERTPTQRYESPDPITGEAQPIPIPKRAPPRTPVAAPLPNTTDSAPSSPLSSPPSPLRPSTPPTAPSTANVEHRSAGIAVVIPAETTAIEPVIRPSSPFYQRSLRQRKPIQVHPYLLEDARYKQHMKERGVRPVRIQNSQEAAPAAQRDSQDAEFVAPVVDDDSQPRRRRNKSNEQESEGSRRREDVPARPEMPTHQGSSNKRRKTGHKARNPSTTAQATPTPAAGGGPQPNDDVYDMPDSPPILSRPMLGHRNANAQAITPLDLPLPSSGTVKRVGLLAILNDSESDSDEDFPPQPPVHRSTRGTISRTSSLLQRRASAVTQPPSSPPLPTARPPVPISSDSESSPSSSEADLETAPTQPNDPVQSKLVSRFRKKGTRGVLPASFIRLNKPLAPEEPARERTRDDGEPEAPQSPVRRPGVARTKISSRVNSGRLDDLFSHESESDSGNDPVLISSTASRKVKPKKSSVAPRSVIDLLQYDSEDMEDNRFDHGGGGGRRSTGTQKKRSKPSGQSKKSGQSSKSGQQTSRRRTTGSSRPRKSTGPRLGIVDAYEYARSTKTPLPTFARIAARSASKRPDQGRQSPSRKTFVLETAQDTLDVQDVLRNWREGTLPFRAPPREMRPPPQRPSVQHRLPSPEHLGDTSSKPKQAKRLAVVRCSSGASKPRQTSLLNHFQGQSLKGGTQRKKTTTESLAVNANIGYITHRPAFSPVPAQIERVLPAAQRRTPWTQQLNHLADAIQARRSANRAATQPRVSSDQQTSRQVTTSGPPRPPTLPQARRVRRKGTPRHVDIDTVERRQPSPEALHIDDDFPETIAPSVIPRNSQTAGLQKPKLSGLLPYGKKYSLNFDIHPLPQGVIFNSETLIGRGDLAKVLQTAPARVSGSIVASTFTFDGNMIHWGVYHDNVATQFETIMGKIGDACERFAEDVRPAELEMKQFVNQAYAFFSFVIRYIADALAFHDPLDVLAFGQRFLQAVERCCERVVLGSTGDDTRIEKSCATKLALQANGFGVLVARQIQLLVNHDFEAQDKLELPRIMGKIGRFLMSRLVRCRFNPIRECYEAQRRRVELEQGIGLKNYTMELWVLAIHVLRSTPGQLGFWELLNEQLHAKSVETSLEIPSFEKLWKAVFTLLPLFQFDDAGIAMGIGENTVFKDNWALVRILTSRPMKVYNANRDIQGGTVNTYIKLLFARCHFLMTKWEWSNPELIIPTLYEFFSSTGLSMLKNEIHRGSPDFLMNLDKSPSLKIQDTDPCFHLLLKVIALGLKKMAARGVNERAINNLTYRLMPNHRKQYPKDKDLLIEHLAILRNNHDLLVTLYWAAPPKSRPPIDAIQLLINPENTHIQACNVVVRAWSNLLRFQLHSGEAPDRLLPLMRWFDYLVIKLLGQHQAARGDAEKQLAAAREGGDIISDARFEENVRQNQRRVEAELVDFVGSLGREMAGIRGDVGSAMVMLTREATATIIGASVRVGFKVMLEVLKVIREYVNTCEAPCVAPQAESVAPAVVDEESQDYGDSSIFEDFEFEGDTIVVVNEEKRAAEHLLSFASGAVFQLLSNCFGADKQPEEKLLIDTVDTWCLLASFLVKNGLKSWDTYLRHGTESWSSLRDTLQTRKFTSYFMPKILGYGAYESNRSDFLLFWMKGLVERESMLAFQNEYTAALLNFDSQNPVLGNLPFVRGQDGRYKISQNEFRTRRLGVIATVLENMRMAYEQAGGTRAVDLKREYAGLVREMMNGMKENYTELQATNHSGAYVEFVHRVIEALQQHATEITPIDRFFTESSAFPLPAGDPNYVVGRLKKYAMKLSLSRNQHALNSFLQSQCERTALTNTHDAFVRQLTAAMLDSEERGDQEHPTLRAYFLEAVFPVYVCIPFSSTVGWIISIPILESLLEVIHSLDTAVETTHPGSLAATQSMLNTLLDSIRYASNAAIKDTDALHRRNELPETFQQPSLLSVFILLIRITTAAIPCVSRFGERDSRAVDAITFILRAAHYGVSFFFPNDYPDAVRPLCIPGNPMKPPNIFVPGRNNAEGTLPDGLRRQWGLTDGVYWFQRGPTRQTIHPPSIKDRAEAIRELRDAVQEFTRVAARAQGWEEVVRDAAPGIWECESRGRPLSKGNTLAGLGGVLL